MGDQQCAVWSICVRTCQLFHVYSLHIVQYVCARAVKGSTLANCSISFSVAMCCPWSQSLVVNHNFAVRKCKIADNSFNSAWLSLRPPPPPPLSRDQFSTYFQITNRRANNTAVFILHKKQSVVLPLCCNLARFTSAALLPNEVNHPLQISHVFDFA